MKHKILKLVFGVSVLCGVAASIFFCRHTQAQEFQEYSEARDAQFMHTLWDENLYWLYAGDPNHFSLEHFLKTHMLTHSLVTYDVTVKLYIVENKPVGFVAYYMKTFAKGILPFLAVAKEYRGHGYGEKLLRFACKDLFARGARTVQLLTRTTNTTALALYQRAGFKEFSREDGFVQLELFRS